MSSPPPHRLIASDLEFPEGPVVLPDGSLLVVEIRGARLTRIGPDGEKVTVAQWSSPSEHGPNGAALGPGGAVYVCNNGGFSWHRVKDRWLPMEPRTGVNQPAEYRTGSIDRVDLESGEITVLYSECDGQRLCGPNDLVIDDMGGIWFTDLGKRRAFDEDRVGVYYARCDGSHIERVIFPLFGPNGIGLSPDGKTLYVAETPTGRLWAFPVTAPGQLNLRDRRCLVNTLGRFDSLGVEEDGTVVVAAIDQGLCVVRPDGEVVWVPVPGPATTNICWGGDDLRTAYVTESGVGNVFAFDWPRRGLRLHWDR
ncbi:SMP-30/gluconolactonase/LRE family protein [Myxococcota bacterium]|nr:SMP-30/gluconolactonase/LRE family protein [Myxococcota bacterium]